MSILFQILFVGLAVYMIARAPDRLLNWLAAVAALEFALILSFIMNISTTMAALGLGGGALLILIHAILNIQDGLPVPVLRLIMPIFPLLFIAYYLNATVALMTYDGGIRPDLNRVDVYLVCVQLFAVISLMCGAIYIALRYIDFIWLDLVFLFIAGVGVAIAFPDFLWTVPVPSLYMIFGGGVLSILIVLQAKSNAGIRRAAIACNTLGLISTHIAVAEVTSLSPGLLMLFGGAVALTCLAVIRHKAADTSANPHGSKHVYGTLGFSN